VEAVDEDEQCLQDGWTITIGEIDARAAELEACHMEACSAAEHARRVEQQLKVCSTPLPAALSCEKQCAFCSKPAIMKEACTHVFFKQE
jgi:hypothetical protein